MSTRAGRSAVAADAMIAVMALVLVVALAILGLAIAFPTAAARLGLDLLVSSPGAAVAAGDLSDMTQGVLGRAAEGFEHRVEPRLDRLRGGVAAPTSETPSASSQFPADSCAECHPNWQERPVFSVVYMPHSLHTEPTAPCERCHAASGAGRDTVPPMSGCAECHDEAADGSKRCDMCHPPGSLFHGAELASSRSISEKCETCHPPRSLAGSAQHDMPAFDRHASTCASCHEPESCEACHPATHPAAYQLQHFNDLRTGNRVQLECYTCHDPARCTLCHAAGGGA